ncbi:MAG: pilus assembly protein N-terminal domain-containing protein [Candidatus Korobacteraceae bacterium]|jgi:pilus assembly protein CpaC
MRAFHPFVKSAVALLLLAVAVNAAEAPAGKTANAKASSKVAAEMPAQEQQIAQQTLAPETQSVHIQVGRSIILNTQSLLRRIVVSNPNVLDTTTVSTTQVVVTAKAPGSSSLVLWDQSSNARIVDVYADVDISGLRDAVRSAYPHQAVQVEAEQGRVIVTGKVDSKAVEDDVLRMAGTYSKEIVNSMTIVAPHEKQIMLKVQFAEVDRIKLEQFGFNILSTGAANTIGATSTGQFGQTTLGAGGTINSSIGASAQGFTSSLSASNLLNVFLFRPDLNLGAMIQDLQQKNVLQILSEPNLMARSGETAKFLAGGEFPFPVVQGGVGSAVAVTIQFKPYGVKLDFTGTIDGDVIRLKIAPEVSTLDFTNAVEISGFEIPAISTRRAETEIELRNGQSFGIAGLLDKRTTSQLSKMPGIGDIPILGQLFRSKNINQTNSELLVMVTPVIVDPLAENMPAPRTPLMSVPNMEDRKFDKLGSKSGAAATTTSN